MFVKSMLFLPMLYRVICVHSIDLRTLWEHNKKNDKKNAFENVVCWKRLLQIIAYNNTDNVSIDANSLIWVHTVQCHTWRLQKHFDKWEKQVTFFVIGALRVTSDHT